MTDVARPFVKWVGGKTQLLPILGKLVPERFGHYYEPFVGGGALLFHLSSEGRLTSGFTIGDQNPDLITTYRVIRDCVEPLIISLRRYSKLYADADDTGRAGIYYSVRKRRPRTAVGDAARMIFLNRTCYNGLYRVNSRGEFNTPMGRYANPTICDDVNLRACSRAMLSKITLLTVCDFERTSMFAQRGDFWYADPPYVPLSASSDFTSYTRDPFGPDQQERLAGLARRLKDKGVHVLLSNSDTPLVRKLYNGFSIQSVQARRAINSRGDRRGKVGEVVIR